MRSGAFTAAVAALLASLALGACGQEQGLLPAGGARAMDAALQRVADATNAGDCAAATRGLAEAQKAYDALPSSVDARLRSLLLRGLEQLTRTVPEQCAGDALLGATGPTGVTGVTGVTGETGPQTETPPETTAPPTTPPPEETIPPQETDPDAGDVPPDPGGEEAPEAGGQGPDGSGPPGQNKKDGEE